jgi:hypothetical protein
MGKSLIIAGVAAVVTIAALSAVPATAASSPDQGALTLAGYGDAPYGTSPTDTAEFLATPAFINSINADPQIGLVAHVGDIHCPGPRGPGQLGRHPRTG